jgi:protein ImuB
MDLEWPLVSLEPFLFLGNAALERLVGRLESQGLACVKLEVTLKLDPDGCDARAIALPAPTREIKTLLTLVRLELEARPPGAPIGGFTFTAHPDKPRRAQLSLFGPAALSPDRLATTIARLAALLGADRVGSPRLVNGHRPDASRRVSYSPPPPTLATFLPKRPRPPGSESPPPPSS